MYHLCTYYREMPPKRKFSAKASVGYGRKRVYRGRASYKRRTFRSYKARSFKRKRVSYKRRLPGSTGRTKGSYGRNLNPVYAYRREKGFLRTQWVGTFTTPTLTAGSSQIYSLFFVGNTVNAAGNIAYLPSSMSDGYRGPPLSDSIYSWFYASMVMYNSLGLKITRTDQNADYGEWEFALTPIRYVDRLTCRRPSRSQ